MLFVLNCSFRVKSLSGWASALRHRLKGRVLRFSTTEDGQRSVRRRRQHGVSLPARRLQTLGGLPLSVTAGQVHATHQHRNPGARALCVLSVALSPSPGQVDAHWKGVTLNQKKNPTLNRLYTAHTSFRLLLLFVPRARWKRDETWLAGVTLLVTHTGWEGGVGRARIRDASCQRRIAFLLICVSADTKMNEEPSCMFQQVREGKTPTDDAKKQTNRKTTPRHPKPLLQKVRCGGGKKKKKDVYEFCCREQSNSPREKRSRCTYTCPTGAVQWCNYGSDGRKVTFFTRSLTRFGTARPRFTHTHTHTHTPPHTLRVVA